MSKMRFSAILAAGFALACGPALSAPSVADLTKPPVSDADLVKYPKTDKRHYLTEKQILFIRPGLVVEVSADDIVVEPDGTVKVTFGVFDDRGLPLDLDGVFTPGPIRARFVLSYIPDHDEGKTGDEGGEAGQHVNYITRTQTSPITGDSAEQPTADSGGSFEKIADGIYTYTFGFKLPADYDADATHVVGMYVDRNLEEFDIGVNVVNKVLYFVPAGGETVKRELVTTAACNNCHDPLAIHGGVRRDVELCIQCHTKDVIDPDTGNSVDLKIMVHKIHMGENLPSVEAGTPYQIIGFRQSVHDYSHVVFPRDVRNCRTCHVEEAAQGDHFAEDPTMEACGSCHDEVNFATGENHVGGPQISDRFCANCHFPQGELEFDASVIGAHTEPSKSTQLEGINIEILEVVNAVPGGFPTVRFSISNDLGEPIAPMDLSSFSLLIAGPTTDYGFLARESARDATPVAKGLPNHYEKTFTTALPEFAMGTYTAGAEGRRSVTLNPGTTDEFNTNESEKDNPVFNFAVTDMEPVARRVAVTDEKCDTCHDNLELHGTLRHDPQYCVTCHAPNESDIARRPAEELPAESIHLKFMVHRIHTGEELMRDYTLYGFGGTPHNYNEVLYPGDLRNCETCHVNGSQQVPSAGLLPTLATENEFYSPIAPDSAACLGCHDSREAAAHASLNTAIFGESCAVCHGEDKDFAVDRVHARIE